MVKAGRTARSEADYGLSEAFVKVRTTVLPRLSSVCRGPLARSEEKYFSESRLRREHVQLTSKPFTVR
jgi:hypothetical protein